MTTEEINKAVNAALDSRKPARQFRECQIFSGDEAAYTALDHLLGDYPGAQIIRKTAVAIDLPEADLRVMAEAPEENKRRIARLILLETTAGISEDSILQKGLSDKSAKIRCDAARFTGTGVDRTRLYNHLVKLIREDPDSRVRQSAGKRLAESFADLYAIDFDGLPPLSRMLILDALAGHSRIDEERAEALLDEKTGETAFRAARILQKWGTLKKLAQDGNSSAVDLLKKAAAQGVADYLEDIEVNKTNRELLVEIAGLAGRDDLVIRFRGAGEESESKIEKSPPPVRETERTVLNLVGKFSGERKQLIEALPLEDPDFKFAIEKAFPPPETDRCAEILFEMAMYGGWTDWSGRLAMGLKSADSGLRRAAALALGRLDPETALNKLPSYLTDNDDAVRKAVASALASIKSGKGYTILAESMKNEPLEEFRNTVIEGIREAGGAALARCVLDNWEYLGAKGAGDLISHGIDGPGVELLAKGFTDESDLTDLLKNSSFEAGLSLLGACPALGEGSRKKLLSCLGASGWAELLPEQLLIYEDSRTGNIHNAFEKLNRDETEFLLKPVLPKADGRSRRQIRRIMKS